MTEVRKSNIIYKKYSYDLVGRLSREDNRDLNKTFTFTYDLAGNILSRKEYTFTLDTTLPSTPVLTVPYTYDLTHKDRLTSYNGQTVGGYEIGNPWTYRGKAATWKNVNRLASYNGITFDYNYGGIRTSKTVNGERIKYAINDNNIISEQKGTDTTTRITYFYGIDGVTAFKYAGATYYYKKNFLGDILGLYNSSKQLVAKYVYDAWGNHKVYALINSEFIDVTEHTITTSTTVNEKAALLNPFRYRSYYFDSETGFYYLQSRYYDPQVGRFLNMDLLEYIEENDINGLNIFCYCNNNPLSNVDYTGHWFWNVVIGAVVGAVVSAVSETIKQVSENGWDAEKWDWKQMGRSVAGGAISGAVSSIPVPNLVGNIALGAGASLLGGLASGSINDKNSLFDAVALGALGGAASYGLKALVTKGRTNQIINKGRKSVSLKTQSLKSVKEPRLVKGRNRNSFKDTSKKELFKLMMKHGKDSVGDMFRNSFVSSLISGWY